MKILTFRAILLCVFIIKSISTNCQEWRVLWDKNWASEKSNYFTDVLEEKDGNYTLFGSIYSKTDNSLDLWLLKISKDGELIWQKNFGSPEHEIPVRFAIQKDGSYLMAAVITSPESVRTFLVKANKEGEELWKKTVQDDNFCIIEDLQPLDNGDYILSGCKGKDKKTTRLWAMQINSGGERIWEKQFAEDYYGSIKSIKKLPDGGFSMAGKIIGNIQNDADVWITRTNSAGEIVWSSHIKSPGADVWPECVCCSPDSCFMVVGWHGTCLNDVNSDNPIFDYDLQVLKLDCKGKVLWTKNFDKEGSEGGNAVAIRPDGNFLIAGVKETSFLGKVGPWLMLVDPNGNLIAETLIPYHFYNDQAKKIINTSEGGIIAIGPGRQEKSRQQIHGWIMKYAAF